MAETWCETCGGKCEFPSQLFFTADHEIQTAVRRGAELDGRSLSDYLGRIVRPELERRGLIRRRSTTVTR